MPYDHPYFIKDIDNTVNHPTGFNMWYGWGSVADHSGPIFRYLLYKVASRPEKTIIVSACSDDMFPIADELLQYAKLNDAIVFAPVLASFGHIKSREYMYIPASDEYFTHSVYDAFASCRIPWEQKINTAIWRGGLSGEMLRINTVKASMNIPNTDIKLVDGWIRPEYNPQKTPELFAQIIDVAGQCKYKAVLWIDGGCLTSNVLWIFATGSVPVLINESEFWFKKDLIPWVHFVPVKIDLSDLEQNIRWIFENDDKACKIAENALEFSRTVLSPEGQRKYLDKAIEEHIHKNQQEEPEKTPTVKHLFPLLTFGGHHNVERGIRKRIYYLLNDLDQFSKTQSIRYIEHFMKIATELLNTPDYPEIHKKITKSIELLREEFMSFPNIISTLQSI